MEGDSRKDVEGSEEMRQGRSQMQSREGSRLSLGTTRDPSPWEPLRDAVGQAPGVPTQRQESSALSWKKVSTKRCPSF